MPPAVSLMWTTVYATSEDDTNVVLDREELSLYTTPQQEFRYVEPEAGQLEHGAATLRKMVEPYSAWIQGAYGRIQPEVQRVTQFGNDTYLYLQNPPANFYPRAGIIGFAGVLGLFLGRSSRMKRVVYPAALMAVGASLYYPERAVAIAKSAGDSVYEWALKGYVRVDEMLSPANKPKKSTAGDDKP
ncbi:MICOS complex subunit MIC26-like [Lampris incognitus]|uniref:MICOS complex subunit MIC26-like n=1 Tax=Lampris incognitus TaxID=2546036 RepID=UPI0024B54712|nr:MICOS complex subunit MIC26-like [Lampris incognitus]